MVLNPTRTEDFKTGMGIQAEFTKDYILYKVSLLAISLYCIGTEMKFINNRRNGENLCKESIKLMRGFFPEECPLIQHFLEIGTNVIGSELQEIPEVRKPKKSRRSNSDLSFLSKENSKSNVSYISRPSSRQAASRPRSALGSLSPSQKPLERHVSHANHSFQRKNKLKPENSRVHVD